MEQSAPTELPKHRLPAFLTKIREVLQDQPHGLPLAKLKAGLGKLGVKINPNNFTLEDLQHALDGMVETGELYIHPGKTPAYSFLPPPKLEDIFREQIQQLLPTLGDSAVPLKKLGQPTGKKATAESETAFQVVIQELLEQQKLFDYGGGKYATVPPPKLEDTIRQSVELKVKLLDEAELVPDSKLGKPKAKDGPEALAIFNEIVAEMVRTGQLFLHGNKFSKTAPKPKPWYETPAYAKHFSAARKAVEKLFAVGEIPHDMIVAELLKQFAGKELPSPDGSIPAPSVGDLLAVACDRVYNEVHAHAQHNSLGYRFDQLYEKLQDRMSIGIFHDALRKLHQEEKIRLSGWNLELHALPRFELAMFHTNKVLYYAHAQ